MGSQMDPRYAIRYELKYHEILEYGLAVNGYVQTMQYIQALPILELNVYMSLLLGYIRQLELWHVS